MSATSPRRSRWSGRRRAPGAEPRAAAPRRGRRARCSAASRLEGPRLVEGWLDALDATGRWALLKLVTGGLRIGVSARLAKQALAELGGKDGRRDRGGLARADAALRRAVRLAGRAAASGPSADGAGAVPPGDAGARASTTSELREARPGGLRGRMEVGRHPRAGGARGRRRAGSTRAPATTSPAPSPTSLDALDFEGALDGELLVGARGGELVGRAVRRSAAAAEPQDRVDAKLLASHPGLHPRLRLLRRRRRGHPRALPFASGASGWRRSSRRSLAGRIDLSPLARLRRLGRAGRAARRAAAGDPQVDRRADAEALGFGLRARPAEGPVVQVEARPAHRRRGADVCPARPRQALVLLFRLHVRRLGTARRTAPELVPVGKAYFGFTDEELKRARPLRPQQHHRALRPGARGARTSRATAWCSRSPSRGCNRSTRHRSGVAMRFPRINRLRWDKPPAEADRLETLEKLLPDDPERRTA